MTIQFALPLSKRDLRLDLFRGLANWAMFLGHVPTSVLAWCSFRNYGFSDGADLFVFISGYTSAVVFTRKMVERGFIVGATRLLRRVWQIYAAHILLFVIYLASIHVLANRFDAPHFIDQFNARPLLSAPVEMMTQGLSLKYKPLNLDVLPLYVVLMGVFPPVLWLMIKRPNLVMLGSALLYFTARQLGWNFLSYPSGIWYFNPFAWQLLFVLGAWLALGGADRMHFLMRSRLVLVLGGTYLLFAALMTLAGQLPELQQLFPRFLFEAFNPNDKTNLGPSRVLHLMVLLVLVARFIPIDAPGLQAAIWRPLIICGQHSLEVFCAGIYLAFLAYFILQMTSDGILAQLLVGAAGISIMTAVAYYKSWSKQVEKAASAVQSRPITVSPHAPTSDLVAKSAGAAMLQRNQVATAAKV